MPLPTGVELRAVAAIAAACSSSTNRNRALTSGGARAVLATVTSAKAMTPVIDGLAVRGRLIVVGVDVEPIEISPLHLIGASRDNAAHEGVTRRTSSYSLRNAAASRIASSQLDAMWNW